MVFPRADKELRGVVEPTAPPMETVPVVPAFMVRAPFPSIVDVAEIVPPELLK
jgi:hypothetical protein